MGQLINDSDQLISAHYKNSEYPIQTYDDGVGPLFISRNSIGINGIVRAQTWEDAYSICEDEFFPEADETIEQIIKECGVKVEHDPGAWMENECFQEGFGFRPNGPNARDTVKHGIYSKDLNGDSLNVLTPELLDQLGIELVIIEQEEN